MLSLRSTPSRSASAWFLPITLVLVALGTNLRAATLDDCRAHFRAGEYERCITAAAETVERLGYGEAWYTTKARAELALGRHADADETVVKGLKRYRSSVQLRLLAREAALHTGRSEEAAAYVVEIGALYERMAWNFTDAADLVAIGRANLLDGGDAREVLETFYQPALEKRSTSPDPLLAIGELALAKNDLELAAETFRKATTQFEGDPDAWSGLGRALMSSDPTTAVKSLDRALQLNPRHVPTLLVQVEKLFDAERYEEAVDALAAINAINPRCPEALAYRSLISELQHDLRGRTMFRDAALATWRDNPHVDHLIGRKLSAKYRFAEGAEHQRRALAFDENFEPARVQLAQDLLRLGEDDEGWATAKEAHERDGYDVATFNLLELHDELAGYTVLESEHFTLRMDPKEAAVYGRRALRLLEEARETLGERYGLKPEGRIVVEIFPNPDDFGVRTFGIPAVGGYLGVCFGRVITANSPASRKDSPNNWEAVLWHEYAHVVTLGLTHNRIPRWISEGISVHEERLRDPSWGQRMNPRYREMVLGGELTPIAELSSAFTSPEDGLHLQFAYYEASLVVEHLLDAYGLESLRNVLADVGHGIPLNVALDRRCAPMPKLQAEFESFATARAEALGPKADWTDPGDEVQRARNPDALRRFVEEHPDNVAGLAAFGDALLAAEDHAAARTVLEHLAELVPDHPTVHARLSLVHRAAGDTAAERAALERHTRLNGDSLQPQLRLLEIAEADGDAARILEHGGRAIAIDPLITSLQRSVAVAAERTDKADLAIEAHNALLALDPDDPAGTHYALARLLHARKNPEARRHVLLALAIAPRYREAHRLLLEMHRSAGANSTPEAKP